MRALGASWSSDRLYLAVADGGSIQDMKPYFFEEPDGLEQVRRLPALANEALMIIQALNVRAVAVLEAEPNYAPPAVNLYDRMMLEAMLAYGAATANIPAVRLSRQKVKSVLGITGKGGLSLLSGQATEPVGPYWTGKRDLAALAALAAAKGAI